MAGGAQRAFPTENLAPKPTASGPSVEKKLALVLESTEWLLPASRPSSKKAHSLAELAKTRFDTLSNGGASDEEVLAARVTMNATARDYELELKGWSDRGLSLALISNADIRINSARLISRNVDALHLDLQIYAPSPRSFALLSGRIPDPGIYHIMLEVDGRSGDGKWAARETPSLEFLVH